MDLLTGVLHPPYYTLLSTHARTPEPLSDLTFHRRVTITPRAPVYGPIS